MYGKESKKQGRETLGMYLREISMTPLLTGDEEKALGARIQKNGDEEAFRRLVEANLRFVVKIAKNYRGAGVSFLDLIHEGNMGLIEAARRYDPTKNVRFISYAVWWIRQALVTAISNLGHPVRLPAKVNYMLYRAGLTAMKKEEELSRRPTINEIAGELGVAPDDLQEIMDAGGQSISLNHPASAEQARALEEVFSQGTDETVERSLIRDSAKKSVHSALSDLNNTEETVLRLRYGLDDDHPRTLKEIGNRLGLSRERIRQIQCRALSKLKTQRNSLRVLSANG
jgi:RNA polymerase primary sigma factor